MKILNRLKAYGDFEIVVFTNQVLLEVRTYSSHNFKEPIESWPQVNCLISFFSGRFPLDKAIAYTKLYPNTFVINDLEKQKVLLDRLQVYKTLQAAGVQVPPHLCVLREPGGAPDKLIETPDYIELDGQRIYKPFIEKPISGLLCRLPHLSRRGSQSSSVLLCCPRWRHAKALP